jgi:hypothetical protein
VPWENYVSNRLRGPKIGVFEAYPVIGNDQPNVIFEYGSGRSNLSGYQRSLNRESQANRVFHSISKQHGENTRLDTIYAENKDAITKWDLIEDIAQADITDLGLRQKLVKEHVRIRKNPRQIISATPHIDPEGIGRLPVFGEEYDLGDSVRLRAINAGQVRLDARVRVWGIDFAINPEGLETQTLLLAEE